MSVPIITAIVMMIVLFLPLSVHRENSKNNKFYSYTRVTTMLMRIRLEHIAN
jgi:hypothetical protein